MDPVLSQTHDDANKQTDRSVRRGVYAFAGLFGLAFVVLFVLNGARCNRIHRINERGGLVKSWSSNVFEPFVLPFGYKVTSFVEDHFVIRQRYEVFFGDKKLAAGCGSGLTLSLGEYNKAHADDSGLEAAKELPGIGSMSLVDASVTDAGLEHLRGMKSLEHLDMTRTLVQGPGLIHLDGLPLQTLSLHGTPLDDAGLEHLPTFPGLTHLDLGGTRITARGLARLKIFRRLHSLDLSETPVTNDMVRELAGSGLDYLNLYKTSVTDAVIPHLESMPNLNIVHLCGTAVTTEAALRSSHHAVRGWVSLRDHLCHHDRPAGRP